MEVEPVAPESDGSLPYGDGGRTASAASTVVPDNNDEPMPASLC
jgi:hypothetical protein